MKITQKSHTLKITQKFSFRIIQAKGDFLKIRLYISFVFFFPNICAKKLEAMTFRVHLTFLISSKCCTMRDFGKFSNTAKPAECFIYIKPLCKTRNFCDFQVTLRWSLLFLYGYTTQNLSCPLGHFK